MAGGTVERGHSLLPDFNDWFGREFPGLPGWRPATSAHSAPFGGAVTAETSDPVARHMVSRGKGGDFRNPERIRAWAHHIGTELGAAP